LVEDKLAPSPFDEVLQADLRSKIMKALSTLPPRHQAVLCFRFGIGHDRDYTLEEVGEKFNLGPSGMRAIMPYSAYW
jgi:RNA polymerase primary sigma factor